MVFVDVRNPVDSYAEVVKTIGQMDMVINCIDKLGAETLSIFMCKNRGTVYFTGLANGYIKAILVAESIRKKKSTLWTWISTLQTKFLSPYQF